MRPVVAWGVATAICWFVALAFLAVPVMVDNPGPVKPTYCGNVVANAFGVEIDDRCTQRARRRLGVFAIWFVVTGAVSTACVARCALEGRTTRSPQE